MIYKLSSEKQYTTELMFHNQHIGIKVVLILDIGIKVVLILYIGIKVVIILYIGIKVVIIL